MARDPDRGREEIAPTVTNSFVVYLVALVYLVEQDQLNEQNKPDQPAGCHASRVSRARQQCPLFVTEGEEG
jgi:hypothetical protein